MKVHIIFHIICHICHIFVTDNIMDTLRFFFFFLLKYYQNLVRYKETKTELQKKMGAKESF